MSAARQLVLGMRWARVCLWSLLIIGLGVVVITILQASAVTAAGPWDTPELPPAPDCNRYVDLVGSCNSKTPCHTSISLAVAAAAPGDGICVFPGTYAESVDLSTMGTPGDIGFATVDSTGSPKAGTATVDPGASSVSGAGLAMPKAVGAAFTTGVGSFPGSVYLSGFVVTSPDDDGVEIITDEHVVIQDVDASGSADAGIDLEEIGGHVIISDTIVNDVAGEGFDIWRVGGDVRLTGCQANRTGWAGIAIWEVNGDIVIDDCEANENAGNEESDGIQLYDNLGSATITDCTTNGNDDDGIDVDDTGGSVTITGCTANDNKTEAGIDVERAMGTLIIDDCTANGNDVGDGVFILATGDVTITNCIANDNEDDGFDVEWQNGEPAYMQQNVRLVNLTARDNGDDGIESDAVRSTFISRVTVVGNGSDAWEFYSDFGQSGDSDVTVENSWLQLNSSEGVDMYDINPSGTFLINGNIICEHTPDVGLYVDPETVINATANWWGAATGPTIASNAGGTGDGIGGQTAQIDYTPWIDTITPSATVDPVAGGSPTLVRFKFSGASGSVFGVGPGDPNTTPPFSLTTDNGSLTSSTGSGETVTEFVNKAGGILEVSLTPTQGGEATVTLTGPCGLTSSYKVTVEGDATIHRVYLPMIIR